MPRHQSACFFATPAVPVALMVAIFAMIWAFQNALPLNHDVGWLLYATGRLLAGDELYRNLIEVNPPLILWLYTAPVQIAKFLAADLLVVFKLLFLSLMALFALIYVRMLDALQSGRHKALNRYFVTFIVLTLGFTETLDFGQREQLVTMLLIPYLLLAVFRFSNREFNLTLAGLIGVLAAVAICLKPYHLVTIVLLELLLLSRSKHILSIFRAETLIMGASGLLYIAVVYVLTPEYFSFILPLALDVYWTCSVPLKELWLPLLAVYFVLLGMSYFAFQKCPDYLPLWIVFSVATLGGYLAYLLAGNAWGYHLIPFSTYAGSLILFGLVLSLRRRLVQGLQYQPKYPAIPFMITLLVCLVVFSSIVSPAIKSSLLLHVVQKNNAKGAFNQISADFAAIFDKAGKYANSEPVYVFHTNLWPAWPLVHYLEVPWASRYPTLWILPGLVRDDRPVGDAAYQDRMKKWESYQIRSVIEDLKKWQPRLIIVDVAEKKKYFGNTQFDYVEYFSQDAEFRALWSHYKRVDRLDLDEFNFAYYVRLPD